LVLLKAFQ